VFPKLNFSSPKVCIDFLTYHVVYAGLSLTYGGEHLGCILGTSIVQPSQMHQPN
jgi:hypothetical protein